MATSGILYSGTPASNVGLYGAKQKFVWSATKSDEPGVTDVSWELYAVGKENATSNTQARTKCVANVYDYGGGSIVGGSGKEICNYDSGSGNYISYKGTKFANGTFQVKHSYDGTGGFKITLDVDIGGWIDDIVDASGTFTLDENIPGKVYIDTGSNILIAIPYLDTGTEWKQAIPYLDNGTEWRVCG